MIPHVYSSIIDKETGDTRIGDVKILLSMVKKLFTNSLENKKLIPE